MYQPPQGPQEQVSGVYPPQVYPAQQPYTQPQPEYPSMPAPGQPVPMQPVPSYPQTPMQPGYPPQQVVYPQQPMMPGYPPQQMMYPQQMQQPMMPMQQPQIIMQPVFVNNVQTNVGVGPQKSSTSMAVRLLYFCFIGWWLGLLWVSTALAICCTIIGIPLGAIMFAKSGPIFFLS